MATCKAVLGQKKYQHCEWITEKSLQLVKIRKKRKVEHRRKEQSLEKLTQRQIRKPQLASKRTEECNLVDYQIKKKQQLV